MPFYKRYKFWFRNGFDMFESISLANKICSKNVYDVLIKSGLAK